MGPIHSLTSGTNIGRKSPKRREREGNSRREKREKREGFGKGSAGRELLALASVGQLPSISDPSRPRALCLCPSVNFGQLFPLATFQSIPPSLANSSSHHQQKGHCPQIGCPNHLCSLSLFPTHSFPGGQSVWPLMRCQCQVSPFPCD